MDFSAIVDNLPFLIAGVQITIVVSVVSLVFAVLIGLVVAVWRLSGVVPLRFVASLYVDFFRSTPLFIQLVWFYYALPILTGISFDALTTGIIGLSIYSASYFAEVFRAGILAVPIGQREAGLAQGMTNVQVMRRVILPQAVRKVLPPAASSFVSLFKDSSLVSVIAVADLMYQANTLAGYTFRPLEVLTVTALIYLALTYPQTVLVNVLHRRTLAVS